MLLAAGLLGCAGTADPKANAKATRELLEEREQAQAERNASRQPLAEEEPASVASLLREGDDLRDRGEHARALWSYLQAHRLDREDPRPLVQIGSLHLAADPIRAEQIFEAMLARDPRSADVNTGLGLAYIAQDKPAAAEEILRRALEAEPNHAPALNALGVLLDRRGSHPEARSLFERASRVQPQSHVPVNNLGMSYLSTGDFHAAAAAFERASRLEPRDAATLNNLGLALARAGRSDEALAAFRRAGSEQAALNNLGYALFLDGEFEQAMHWYERALLTAGPLAPEIRKNIVALETARSRRAGQ